MLASMSFLKLFRRWDLVTVEQILTDIFGSSVFWNWLAATDQYWGFG